MKIIPYKWIYYQKRRLIVSRQTVTNADVEEIVDWAIDAADTRYYRVWSGVHGVQGGFIQVDDERFYQIDKEELATTYPHYKVSVHRMEVLPLPPQPMLSHLRDTNATTILAWCYSDGFVPEGLI